MSSNRPSKSRRRKRSAGRAKPAAAAAPAPEAGPDPEPPETAPRPSGPPPATAALVAFVLCLWGQSLLLFDWARRTVFEGDGNGHLVLVAPIFGGAALFALLAFGARAGGRPAVGGPVVHALGLASGLLGLTAVVLVLWLGPSVQHGEAASRLGRARAQLQVVGRALDLHLEAQGTYPVGFGVETLAAALAPEYLEGSFPLRDAWGAPLHYQSLGGGAGYLLLSTGPDGVQDLTDDEYISEPPLRRATNDLVLLSGRFVAGAPETSEP